MEYTASASNASSVRRNQSANGFAVYNFEAVAEASGNSDGGMLLNVGSGGTELMVRSSVERWCLPVVFGARVLLLGIFIFKRKRR